MKKNQLNTEEGSNGKLRDTKAVISRKQQYNNSKSSLSIIILKVMNEMPQSKDLDR